MTLRLLAVATGCLFAAAYCGRSALQAPSDMFSQEYPCNMTTILFSDQDLRELYCQKETIKDREKRGVCRTDGLVSRKFCRELPVSTNTTVLQVLYSLGITNWNGNQKQIKVIKKNAIVQSVYLRSLKSDLEQQRFVQTLVAPGDMVVLCLRQE